VYQAATLSVAASVVVRLLELYSSYWSVSPDRFIDIAKMFVDALVSLYHCCSDFACFIRTQLFGGHEPPEESIIHMESQGLVDTLCRVADMTGPGKGDFMPHFVTSAVSIAVPIVMLLTGAKQVGFDSITACVTKLGNSCRGWENITRSFKDMSSFVRHAVANLLGIELDTPRALLVKRVEDLRKRLQELHDALERSASEVLGRPNILPELKKTLDEVNESFLAVAKSEENTSSLAKLLEQVKYLYVELRTRFDSIYKTVVGKQVPVIIWLFGDSGTGKSVLAEYVVKQLGAHEGKTLLVYSRSKEDAFWSNHAGQEVILHDDFNSTIDCVDHQELNQEYTSAAYLLNMAGVSEKGSRYAARYVIICSNYGFVHESKTLRIPAILDRRRDFVIRCVDPHPLQTAGTQNQSAHASDYYKSDWSHLEFTRMSHYRNGMDELQEIEQVSIQKIVKEAYDLQVLRQRDYNRYVDERVASLSTPPDVPDGEAPTVQRPVGMWKQPTAPPRDVRADQRRNIAQQVAAADQNQAHIQQQVRAIAQQFGPQQPRPFQPGWMPRFDHGAGRGAGHLGGQFADGFLRPQGLTGVFKPSVFWLLGPPGIGKTNVLNHVDLEKYDVVDECAESIEKLEDTWQRVLAVSNGHTTKGLVIACNEGTFYRIAKAAQWSSDDTGRFKRRCIRFKYTFNRRGLLSHYTCDDVAVCPDDYARFVSVTMTIAGKKTDVSPMNVLSIIGEHTKHMEHTEDFDGYATDILFQCPENELYLDFPDTEPVNVSPVGVVSLLKRISDVSVFTKFAGHVMDWSIEYRTHRFNTWKQALDAFAVISPPYAGESMQLNFKNNVIYQCASVRGKLTLYRDDTQTVLPPVRFKSLKDMTGDCSILAQDYSLPVLDVIAFVVKIFAGFATTFLAVRSASVEEHLQEEGWGEEMDEVDPIDETGYQAWKKSRIGQQQPKVASRDVSSTGLVNRNVRKVIAEAKRPGKLGVYGAETKQLRRDEIHTEAKASASGHGLMQEILTHRKNVSLEIEKPPLTAEASCDPGARAVMKKVTNNQVQACDAQGNFINYAIRLRNHLCVSVGHTRNYVTHIKQEGVLYEIEKTLDFLEGRDIWFFQLVATAPMAPDVTNHLMSKTNKHFDLSGISAYFAQRDIQGDVYSYHIILQEDTVCRVDAARRFGTLYHGHQVGLSVSPVMTEKGDCGSPIIIINTGYPQKFLGFHIAGSQDHALCAPVYKDDIPMESHGIMPIARPFDNVTFYEEPIGVDGVHLKVVGETADGYEQHYPPKTKYHTSVFSGLDIGVHYEPAVLSIDDPRCSIKIDPILNGLLKYDLVEVPLETEILDRCVKDISNYLADKIQMSGMRMKVLTKKEAINRYTKIPGSNPIYLYSSAGFPFTSFNVKCKRELFEFDEAEQTFNIADTDNGRRLHYGIDSIINTARRGERPVIVYTLANKDEPLKPSKIIDTNTRSIASSPIHATLASRMYFHTFSAAVTTLFNELPIKIGINPTSIDWEQLLRWHQAKGSEGFDCDFKGWDNRLDRRLLMCCADIANVVYRRCDPEWKPEHDVIRSSIYLALNQAHVLYRNLIIQVPGGQMTGQPQTAFDNSMVNWIYAYYVWIKLSRKHAPRLQSFASFNENVACSFYGDDCIFSNNPLIMEWFNFVNYAEECTKLGLTVTPADKDTSVLQFQPIEKLTFLKRRFTRIDGLHYGALEVNSIQRMLDFTTGKPHFWYREPDRCFIENVYAADIISGILRESLFHGQVFFDKIRAHLLRCIVRWRIPVKQIPTYDDVYREVFV
jgi:Cdc6-like AAA superfamily ATPase